MDPFVQGLDEASAARVKNWVEARSPECRGARAAAHATSHLASLTTPRPQLKTGASPYADPSASLPAYGAARGAVRAARAARRPSLTPAQPPSRQPTAPPWSPSPYKARGMPLTPRAR